MGRAFWNELTLAPIYDGQGQVKNLVATQNDVTARMAAEAREDECSAS